MDLTGDGKDEFLLESAVGWQVLGPDLKDLWSDGGFQPGDWTVLPAARGRPGLVILPSNIGRDGATGLPLWAVPPNLRGSSSLGPLEVGEPTRPPRWFGREGLATVCRRALPLNSDASMAPARGALVRHARISEDPRWTRPLPWTEPLLATTGAKWFFEMIALALINVAIPLVLIRLAARRRPWTIRLLLALPIAAAVPLAMLQAFEPMMPAEINAVPVSPRRVFLAATLAGVPYLAIAGLAGWCLVRRRWKMLGAIVSLALAATAATAGGWIAHDVRFMTPLEHYDRSGWPLVFVPGVGVAGTLVVLAWILRRPIRWLRQPRRTASPPS